MRSPEDLDTRLGVRLAELRARHGWSLGELAERSGVSRSTLSRAERAEISPTAALLNRLCHVRGRTVGARRGPGGDRRGTGHHLDTGDCLRMRVFGPTRFRCAGPGETRYVPAAVRP